MQIKNILIITLRKNKINISLSCGRNLKYIQKYKFTNKFKGLSPEIRR